MNRNGLRFLAVFLTLAIAGVLLAGLDNLPRGLRKQVDAERASLAGVQAQVRATAAEVNRELQQETPLFQAIPASAQWPVRLTRADSLLESANRDMEGLSRLEKQNRRQDRRSVETLLSEERTLRAQALAEATGVQAEAAHWIGLKQRLPQTLESMEKDYQSIHGYDLSGLTAAINKAAQDWPEKKADLETRLAVPRNLSQEADTLWANTAEARRHAADHALAPSDIGALVASADRLNAISTQLPKEAGALKSLSGELYESWDKILVDMETRGIGRSREYDQKIRTVRTRFTDSGSAAGATSSEDRWVETSRSRYETMQDKLGMAIEHKPAGKYDSEADQVAQPAGFAYIAPPSQGSNQYGRWEHRDGRDFWVFYGQYALLRDLLFNRDYRPLDRGEYDGYRASRNSGQTYYGRDATTGSQPKYGSQGTATRDRYSGSTFAQGGGFRDSPYAGKSGTFNKSPYATAPSNREPRAFGRNSRREEPQAARPPSRPSTPSFRPSPSPRPFRVPRMPGRRFGR